MYATVRPHAELHDTVSPHAELLTPRCSPTTPSCTPRGGPTLLHATVWPPPSVSPGGTAAHDAVVHNTGQNR